MEAVTHNTMLTVQDPALLGCAMLAGMVMILLVGYLIALHFLGE